LANLKKSLLSTKQKKKSPQYGKFKTKHYFLSNTSTKVNSKKKISRIYLFLFFLGLWIYSVSITSKNSSTFLIDVLSYFNLFLFSLFLGDLNTLLLFFFFIFGTFLITTNTALHLLLTAELLWITLYIIVLFIGLVYDNLNFLSLTFFFLIFSAVEFGVGLILLLLQHLLTRSLNLYDSEVNVFKFMNRFNRTINVNRLVWKY
jgi:NADH:ubiquinone oxidoreductase subunit K